MKFTLKKFRHEGERYPRGYGLAWIDYNRNIGICYPYPLNLILGWLRNIYFKIRCARADDMFREVYSAGVRSGMANAETVYQKGVKDGEAAHRERILKGFNDNLNKIKE